MQRCIILKKSNNIMTTYNDCTKGRGSWRDLNFFFLIFFLCNAKNTNELAKILDSFDWIRYSLLLKKTNWSLNVTNIDSWKKKRWLRQPSDEYFLVWTATDVDSTNFECVHYTSNIHSNFVFRFMSAHIISLDCILLYRVFALCTWFKWICWNKTVYTNLLFRFIKEVVNANLIRIINRMQNASTPSE